MADAGASPSAPPTAARPATASAPPAPAAPSPPATPDKPAAAALEKELAWSEGNDCGKIDGELKRRMRIFNAKLATQKLSIRVVRCHRDAALQRRWHYARFVSWSEAEVKSALRDNTSDQKAKEVRANALRLFKTLEGLKADDEARQRAGEIRDKDFKSNPVLPAEDNCPCGCGWPRSKHVDDPSKAVDINIIEVGTIWDSKVVNSTTTKADKNYDLINKFTEQSSLVWGINFTQIPADPVHWELP